MSKDFQLANPNPEFLIKSIAEQGYSLETALADLMDNSITANANRIEVLTNTEDDQFLLFMADDGDGMNEKELLDNMQFPSNSPDNTRDSEDLGRFGLGLKTASFSQTRCFTVLSRKNGDHNYSALTWDVNYLREIGEWRIKINSTTEISEILETYTAASENHLNKFVDYKPNTIVLWKGLYKFENYIDSSNKSDALFAAINERTSQHLSIVFHRFMEDDKRNLKIRINNTLVKPFNPFPSELRVTEARTRVFEEDKIKIQGYVVPHTSIKESREKSNKWTPNNRSLTDMEGIYIYRVNRLIFYGGWNGLIKKMPRLQLARLKVEIGNKVDTYFHLNVAKSQISIPYDLRRAFLSAIVDLKEEAQKEYYNREIRTLTSTRKAEKHQFFTKRPTNKGVLITINDEFPLLKELRTNLKPEQRSSLNVILKLASNMINKIRQVDNIEILKDDSSENLSIADVITAVKELLSHGLNKQQIKKDILPSLNIDYKQNQELENLLK